MVEAEPGEVRAEARFGRRDPEVGHQREAEATADGRALDRRHHGGARREQTHRFVVEVSPRVVAGRVLPASALAACAARATAEVGSRAKVAALRSQHDGATAVFCVQRLERIAELLDQRAVEEVVGRALDLGQRDMVVRQRDVHVTEDPELVHRGNPTRLRAMIMRWICPVPSTMSIAFTSL